MCSVLLYKSLWGASPKLVYVRVWNAKGLTFPDSLRFACSVTAKRESETRTQEYDEFNYIVASLNVHHISIQCGNFKVVQWSPGDKLTIYIAGQKKYVLILDDDGEQYGPDILLKGR